ncbi:peptidase S41 [Tamlana sedimentorum]|uniref:Peptidase S41 n=1 Tax=Neotamlana sedimentorum TaxID=1435349 RepID=A0A0D7VYF1_9FLAO|nr:S41 family peptidase [Tamlana sedimentorum]KJD31861.1 peptidase S41 [Tamlana sedimentorum]
MKIYIVILLSIFTFNCNAQNENEYLTKSQIEYDLTVLDEILQNTSSYQGLNGYEYKKDFDKFLNTIEDKQITKFDFEIFLSKTIGKIGDRHSYIRGKRLRNSLFFPLAFAPLDNKVLVIDYNRENKDYHLYNTEFPYLKSINNIPIEELISQILPKDILAPKQTHFTRSIRELREIENVFKTLNIKLPNPIQITLTNKKGLNKKINIKLVPKAERQRIWDERFRVKNFFLKEEESNDKEIIKQFFTLKNNIGYVRIVDMLDKEDSPIFFEFLNNFMSKAKQTDALIIDVRDNGGGTRDLIQEFAGYLIHPDSVYVVNATKQRGKLPLNDELKEYLHYRFLYSKNELDKREQKAIDKFMTSFKPMYNLDNSKFSDYHYYILNGQKITKDKYLYDKPIYILTNERSFSAASVFISVFKGLPNIKIAGVNTDGSSGNSERFELPNSELRGKISTMVSFQKDGNILDGIGTKPDILIERNLDQVFWKEDYQLNKLIRIIEQE